MTIKVNIFEPQIASTADRRAIIARFRDFLTRPQRQDGESLADYYFDLVSGFYGYEFARDMKAQAMPTATIIQLNRPTLPPTDPPPPHQEPESNACTDPP